VCEQRDRKGLYAKARAGLLPEFTGVSDPYEEPTDPDLVLDGQTESPEQAADRVMDHLRERGYLPVPDSPLSRPDARRGR
jgi:sulfate adenylyltransferase